MVKKGNSKTTGASHRPVSKASKAKKPAQDANVKYVPVKDVQTQMHVFREQQQLLNIFRTAFGDSVKQALFERDFARAFGSDEHLAVYAARWSPTRALCYAPILRGIQENLRTILYAAGVDGHRDDDDQQQQEPEQQLGQPPRQEQQQQQQAKQQQVLKMLSIGGGAAELVAFGSFLSSDSSLGGDVTLLDSAPWSSVIHALERALTTPPPLSKYASEAAKINPPSPLFLPSRLSTRFIMQDILIMPKQKLLSEAIGVALTTSTASPSTTTTNNNGDIPCNGFWTRFF
ncbi:hypothetical protein QBC46DRAFT_355051 [Diplogelasinospora grovesii]|uniref:Uncharacterized protein n=1 Tax=Diplogelasinospora grovesii TaxID=303347 RepID=A0AAN6N5B8_9PEZI|nr:hypothetical protein QBC46DRAFT_355051 [Diplogelasinospora grovesii]